MRRSDFGLFVLFVTFVALPFPGSAQTAQVWSVQGSLLGASFEGDESFEGVTFEFGYGAEFQLRWNPSTFSVGAGLQYTSHEVTFDNGADADVTVEFSGVFIEPRYVIFIGSDKAAPYLSARLMRLVATLSAPDFDFEDDFDAWGYNIGGGLLVRLTDRMNLDVGLTAGGVTFVYEDEENENGTSAVGRLGVAIGI